MTAKELKSVRVDPDIWAKAQAMGLDASAVMNAALEKAVKEKKCPLCGQKIKK